MLEATQINDYQEALIELYGDMDGSNKPAAPLEPATEESLERYVLEKINIKEEDLHELGRVRAEIVKQQLVEGGVDPERLSALAPENITSDPKPAVEIQLVS
ncbi:MAG TPA: hypothetical protein VF089_08715, partial [Candidatus Binatia bacterium]